MANLNENAISKELWYVYKAYSGCIDSSPIWYFDSKKNAKKAVKRMQGLQKDGSDHDQLWAFNEGWEFKGYWTYERLKPHVITIEEFEAEIEKTLKEDKK